MKTMLELYQAAKKLTAKNVYQQPFPNEHSARLRNPDDFDMTTFKRTEGGAIFGSKQVPTTIGIIWAKLKGAAEADDAPLPQALRFPTEDWTVQEAREWLEENEIEFSLFEPATDDDQSAGSTEWKQINVPMQAFSMDAHEVNVGTNGEGKKSGPLRLVALSGDPFEGYFGQTIQDLEGMTHGKRIAVDYGHDDKEVIGYINKFSTDEGQLVLDGALTPFGDSDRASEIIHKSAQGVPYQASIFFAPARPGDTQIEELPSGKSADVNGRKIQGPATIFRKWVLRGVAITPYGMDAGTAAFLQKQGNQEVQIDMKKGKKGHKQGSKLAAALDKAIAAKVTDDTDREAIITSIASTVGIDAAAVNQILDGSIDCPELEQLQGFAKWLGVDEDTLVSAAVEDGCEFSGHEDGNEGDEGDQSSKQKKAPGKGSSANENGDFKKFRQFIKLFGQKKGEEYFDKGLDLEAAQAKYIQSLEAKNKKLVEAGPDAAVFDSDDGEETPKTRFSQKQVDKYCEATGSTNAKGIMKAEEERAEKAASKK